MKYSAALTSYSTALSHTPAEAAGPLSWEQCVAWCACLLPKFYCLTTHAMCVNYLPKVTLDGAVAGTESAISSRKSNALTTLCHWSTLHRLTTLKALMTTMTVWQHKMWCYGSMSMVRVCYQLSADQFACSNSTCSKLFAHGNMTSTILWLGR